MAGKINKVSFFLTGGIQRQSVDEMRGQYVQQNSAPLLTESLNTRLTILGETCSRSPDFTAFGPYIGFGNDAFGIAPSSREKNYATYALPSVQTHKGVVDTYADGIVTDKDGIGSQNHYVPLVMSGAGQLVGVIGNDGCNAPVSCHLQAPDTYWYYWRSKEPDGSYCRYAAVHDREGNLVAGPQRLYTDGEGDLVGTTPHYALTPGTIQYNSVFVWQTVNGLLSVFELSISSGRILSYPRGAVYGGVAISSSGFALVQDDTQTVTYVCASPASAVANGLIYRIQGHSVTAEFTGVGYSGTSPAYAVTFARFGQVATVAASWRSQSGSRVTLFDEQLNVTHEHPLFVPQGAYATRIREDIQPLWCQATGDAGFVLASGGREYSGKQIVYVQLRYLSKDGDPPVLFQTLWHQNLILRGASWRVGEGEQYPIFVFGRAVPDALDPALTAYMVGPTRNDERPYLASPIARFGCVRGIQSPAEMFFSQASYLPSSGLTTLPDESGKPVSLFIPYILADRYASGRYVMLSYLPEQPTIAHDRDGAAIIAAALTAQWDGVETVEYGGPLFMPYVWLSSLSTGALAPGTYSVAVTYEWSDGSGLDHRSMPSTTKSMTLAAGQLGIRIEVASPTTMRDGIGQGPIYACVYMTPLNMTSYNLVASIPLDTSQPHFAVDVTVNPSDAQPIIYSRGLLGEEIVPQPPPPLRDVAIVGSRAWGVDAEIPTRLVYSKLRVSGVGFEFFPAGEVIVPSNAGDVYAIREYAGTIVIFAERGVYQVSDGGPNNMGTGSFTPPYKLSDIGTHSRRSVIVTPQGVLFLANNGAFALLVGGAVMLLPGAELREEDGTVKEVIGTYSLEDGDEAVALTHEQVSYAFNYAQKKFTHWNVQAPMTLVVQNAGNRNEAIAYSKEHGSVLTLTSPRVERYSPMSWETDWLLLGGDSQDYVVVYDVLFSARVRTQHSVTISMFTDYRKTPTTVRTWTGGELEKLTSPDTGRYTVRIEPVIQDARAIKIGIAEEPEGEGEPLGMMPYAVTILFSVDGLTYEESNLPGSQK